MNETRVATFISTLIVHFPFKHETPEARDAWLVAMTRELHGYDAEVLKRAAEQIIRHRKDRRFPLASECRQACAEAKKWIDAESGASTLAIARSVETKYPQLSRERMQLAADLIRSDMGKRAAKEGWVKSLFDHCVDHARMPHDHEVGAVKERARQGEEGRVMAARGGGVMAEKWIELGARIAAEGQELADYVLGRRHDLPLSFRRLAA